MTETLVTNPEQSEAFDQQFNRIVQTLGLLPADVRAEVLDFPAQREAVLKARRGLNRQQRAVLRTLDILSRMAVLDTEVVSVNLENISVTEASAAGTSRRSNENTILKDIPNTSRTPSSKSTNHETLDLKGSRERTNVPLTVKDAVKYAVTMSNNSNKGEFADDTFTRHIALLLHLISACAQPSPAPEQSPQEDAPVRDPPGIILSNYVAVAQSRKLNKRYVAGKGIRDALKMTISSKVDHNRNTEGVLHTVVFSSYLRQYIYKLLVRPLEETNNMSEPAARQVRAWAKSDGSDCGLILFAQMITFIISSFKSSYDGCRDPDRSDALRNAQRLWFSLMCLHGVLSAEECNLRPFFDTLQLAFDSAQESTVRVDKNTAEMNSGEENAESDEVGHEESREELEEETSDHEDQLRHDIQPGSPKSQRPPLTKVEKWLWLLCDPIVCASHASNTGANSLLASIAQNSDSMTLDKHRHLRPIRAPLNLDEMLRMVSGLGDSREFEVSRIVKFFPAAAMDAPLTGNGHCELFHRPNRYASKFGHLVGVSKRCCYVCGFVLDKLKMVASDIHPNLTGCVLPSGLDPEVKRQAMDHFSKALAKAGSILAERDEQQAAGRKSPESDPGSGSEDGSERGTVYAQFVAEGWRPSNF